MYGFKYSYAIQIICKQLYDFKYFYLIQIICTQLYGFQYSYLIQIICSQLYGFKYSYLIQIICTHLYGFKYSYVIQIICNQLNCFKYSYLIQIIFTQLYGFKYSYVIHIICKWRSYCPNAQEKIIKQYLPTPLASANRQKMPITTLGMDETTCTLRNAPDVHIIFPSWCSSVYSLSCVIQHVNYTQVQNFDSRQ